MAFVPNEIFTLHEKISDDILDNKNITVKTNLIYPEITQTCPNCVFDSATGSSSNKYKTGGPISFTYGICPYCHGKGKINTPSGDTVYLRMYYDSKSIKKIAGIEIPEGDAVCIGYIADKQKLKKAITVIPSYEIAEYGEIHYRLKSEPQPWGLSKDKYFYAHLSRES